MESHHHKIGEEFPEYRDQIHSLKMRDTHFARVLRNWEELDKRIARAASRIELMSEDDEEQLRRKRLELKDELYTMLRGI